MMKFKNISCVKTNVCTGCSYCCSICPCNAISMVYSKEGFLVPYIDSSKCIGCGKCLNNCPPYNKRDTSNTDIIDEYLGYSTSPDDILKSSSGAVAFAISCEFIKKTSGCVIGVSYVSNNLGYAEYTVANKIQELEQFRGSKYIQANKNNIYSFVRNESKKRKILIIGLPCEIAAFRKSIVKEFINNVYFCDLVCFGPTSSKITHDFLELIRTNVGGEGDAVVNMRYKVKNERPYLYCRFENGKTFCKPLYKTDYGLIFNLIGRENCAECKYINLNSEADISIGDCIVTSSTYSIYNQMGLSRIIIRTKNGEAMVNEFGKSLILVRTEGETERFYKNRKLRENSDRRNNFFKSYVSKGYKKAVKETFGIIRKHKNYILSDVRYFIDNITHNK